MRDSKEKLTGMARFKQPEQCQPGFYHDDAYIINSIITTAWYPLK